eukprot:Skav232738  [mRNA]  locus=scaffold1843:193796:195642:- [translate_table: standard]
MAGRRSRTCVPLALLAFLAYASAPAFVGGGVAPRGGRMFEKERPHTALAASKDLQQVISKIKDSISEGEFGKRGEEYVAAQVFLILCVFVGTVPLLGASRLVLTGVLYLVLDKKSDMEEDSLMEKFSDYSKYREKTPSKLLPDVQSLLSESSGSSTIDV